MEGKTLLLLGWASSVVAFSPSSPIRQKGLPSITITMKTSGKEFYDYYEEERKARDALHAPARERAFTHTDPNEWARSIFDATPEMYIETRDELLGKVDSHELLDADEDNDMLHPDALSDDKNCLYVDEPNCIGCTNCAMVARNTFLMEDWFGRARVFQQFGDSKEILEEAVSTCPVNCIHQVTREEVIKLEKHRQAHQDNVHAYTMKAKLVGGDNRIPSWDIPLKTDTGVKKGHRSQYMRGWDSRMPRQEDA